MICMSCSPGARASAEILPGSYIMRFPKAGVLMHMGYEIGPIDGVKCANRQ